MNFFLNVERLLVLVVGRSWALVLGELQLGVRWFKIFVLGRPQLGSASAVECTGCPGDAAARSSGMAATACRFGVNPRKRMPWDCNHDLASFFEAGGDADAPEPPICIACATQDTKPPKKVWLQRLFHHIYCHRSKVAALSTRAYNAELDDGERPQACE